MTLREKVIEVLKYRLGQYKENISDIERKVNIEFLEYQINRLEEGEDFQYDIPKGSDLEEFNGLYQFQLYRKTSSEKKEEAMNRALEKLAAKLSLSRKL